jgi:hypothetical protein
VGVFAAGGLSPASASAAGRGLVSSHVSKQASASQNSASPNSASQNSAMQTVTYDGYSVSVPASWRVFNLDSDPGQCVRYDINAVYLGRPGANQNCPSNLRGRAETITITPSGVSKSGQVSTGAAAADGGLVQSPPPSIAGDRIAASNGSWGQLNEYSQAHELRGSMAGGNLSVTATWGPDGAPVTNYLRGIHREGQGQSGWPVSSSETTASRTTQTTSTQTTSTQTTATQTTPVIKPATTKPATTKPATTPATTKPAVTSTLTGTVKASVPKSPLPGFDTCTAPSLNAMKAWKSKYSAIGVYIGGQNMACDYGNLSASWVKSVHALGWSLMPIYVGLQAPCNSFASINAKSAATEGTQAADTAVGDAASFGLGKGSPIYDDMESYNNSKSSCKTAVLQFLDAWTKEIHAKGYVSGVYSSASTGITDLAAATTVSGHAMNQPDALWFALWDKKNNLTGTPYLASTKWAADRVKQYSGNQNVKVGSYTLNIDADWVGGAVSAP